jgi:GT2 family glycosyltransferase
MAQPAVSFVIPVRNDAARLERCILSIQRSTGSGEPPEIIVVDNRSTDGSGDVARALGTRVLLIGEGNVAELRNAGARAASGDLLAFVDADHEIGEAWIAAARAVFEAPDIVAAGALCHPPESGTWVQRAYGILRGVPQGVHDVEWLGSGNLAVRHRVFDALGGFDASLTTCEDVDLCNRIRAAGHRIVSCADMKNVHYGDPDTLWHVFKGELWRGRDNLRVTLRGPLTWRALPSVLIPVADLAAGAAALAGLVAAATGASSGWLLLAAALVVIGGGTALRVVRALARSHAPLRHSAQVAVVALVYDLARACALVARAPHRSGRAVVAVVR